MVEGFVDIRSAVSGGIAHVNGCSDLTDPDPVAVNASALPCVRIKKTVPVRAAIGARDEPLGRHM